MATEAIISDVGAIYKRLFHHRPVIQNEVHLFVREFEVRRGNNDLQCLQSCVGMVSEMETVFLEDMATLKPNFRTIHNLSAEVSELGNEILAREKEDMGVSVREQKRLDKMVEDYRVDQERETAEFETETRAECQRLEEEIRTTRESYLKLRTVSVGSSAGLSLSLSNNGEEEEMVEEEEEEVEVEVEVEKEKEEQVEVEKEVAEEEQVEVEEKEAAEEENMEDTEEEKEEKEKEEGVETEQEATSKLSK